MEKHKLVLTAKQMVAIVDANPNVERYLSPRAKWLIALARPAPARKDYGEYLNQIVDLITQVYYGTGGTNFIADLGDIMVNEITGAVLQAWDDYGTEDVAPTYLGDLAIGIASNEAVQIPGLYDDLLVAAVNQDPIGSFLARAEIWANRWNDAYNQAVTMITAELGGRLMWRVGPTEQSCPTCQGLDGIVAYATEWQDAGVTPQNAPNSALVCEGWHCQCELLPTDDRRSRGALDRILGVIS